jgi:hypothetical protein
MRRYAEDELDLGTVMLTGSQGQGDKELEANVKAGVGFQLLALGAVVWSGERIRLRG